MSTAQRGLPAASGWARIETGADAVGVAERDALGTSARVAVWPRHHLAGVLAVVDAELARLDAEASRFRADSEISAVHRHPGDVHLLSEGLAEAIAVALAAAWWTGGLVDPTVGGAVEALGYDRDFAVLPARRDAPLGPADVPGWRSVRLDGRRLRLPAGSRLDLGATAKGLGSDRAARAAAAAAPGGGVLVSLGGDVAVAGEAPNGGWPLLVTDEQVPANPARARGRRSAERSPGQVVRLAAGGLATSSIMARRWQRGGHQLHHIVDPRTGLPADGPWRTASVAAANCAEANAAATAAIIAGDQAGPWLAGQGWPARLVAHDGSVRYAGGWPAASGGLVETPARCRMPASAGVAMTGISPPGGRPWWTGRPPTGPGSEHPHGARRWR